jgi:fatty acid amide hydrolase 2
MDPLLSASATALADAIRRRQVSSAEVVEAHVRHLERLNPTLNAVVADRFEAAREEAAEADRRLAHGERTGPLHGVPCSIKETAGLAGMPLTAGLVSRKGIVAERDGAAVARLRAAGAIPLGVTNVSELCMWMESHNRVYGRSNNPYDPRRTVGGSSGGEGAVVGAGGAPFGLGSDIGGSIRMPAFFNGVFGHKPTGGLIDVAGQWPLPAEPAMRYLTTGPITRRAEDLGLLMRILAEGVGDPAAVDLRTLTVLSVEDDGRIPVHPDLVSAQREAARALADRGAAVRVARIPGLRRSLEIWSAMLDAAGGPSFRSMLGGGREIDVARELLKLALGRSPHTLPALGLALVEKLPKLLGSRSARFVEEGRALRREIVELLGPRGVLLHPPHPRPAPLHDQPLWPPWYFGYTAIFNVLELPVTQVPLGLDGAGVPLGVQVAAVHGSDHLTLAVAEALEDAFGGWVPPPMARRVG